LILGKRGKERIGEETRGHRAREREGGTRERGGAREEAREKARRGTIEREREREGGRGEGRGRCVARVLVCVQARECAPS
jgi:hypothetical protein